MKQVTTKIEDGRHPLDKTELLRAYLIAQASGESFRDLADGLGMKLSRVYQAMRKIKSDLKQKGIDLPGMRMNKPRPGSIGQLLEIAKEFGLKRDDQDKAAT